MDPITAAGFMAMGCASWLLVGAVAYGVYVVFF